MDGKLYFVVLVCLAIAPAAQAQTPDEPPLFDRGTLTLQAYPAYEVSGGRDNANLASITLGMGYYVLDNVGLNLELSGYNVNQRGPDTLAAGVQLLLRHHLWQHERFTLFADVAGGIFRGEEQVPWNGTHANFTFRSGLGITWQLRERMHLMGGLRYFHLSNAARRGVIQNPSVNGVEGYVGLLFEL